MTNEPIYCSDHAAEIFDGIAVANSEHANLEAYLKDHRLAR